MLVLEFLGCAFLLFMVTSVGTYPVSDGSSHGINIYKLVYVVLIVYVIICAIGPFTGAHINPAISLGVFMDFKKRRGKGKVVAAYMVAQFLGGFVGAMLSAAIYDNGQIVFE